MPNEIPDSDGESDCEPRPRAAEPLSVEQKVPDGGNGELDVNFDDFISQTQSAKDGSSQFGQTKRSTASTQKHLRDALEKRGASASSSNDGARDVDQSVRDASLPTSGTGERKRTYSETGGGHDQKASSQNRTKRAKSYSATSRRIASTQDIEEPLDSADMDQSAVSIPSAAISPPQAQEDEEDIVPRAKNRPRRIVSLLGDPVSNAGHVLSMSNSSMGGYQSYIMDFRGPGTGLDIDANPFGALSQVSVEASIEHTVQNRTLDLSSTVPPSISPRQPGRDAISPLTDAGYGPQPTAEVSTSIDPSVLTFQPPEESQMLTSPAVATAVQIPPHAHEIGEPSLEVDIGSNYTEEISASKKRGQGSKASRQPSLDSVKDVVTDQQDNDEHAIGLPREQYKPRPSKSRGSTAEPERQSQQTEDEPHVKRKGRQKSLKVPRKAPEHNSPAKLPTSELNLSDEAIIGLPKENYKPRPSRRRSRMIAEDETSIVVDTESVHSKGSHEQQVQSQQSDHSEASHTIEVAEAPSPKPKKGKKAKVKRAKTLAAHLLKKSEPMISDGEDDVLWMETKPAKIKLDIPADLFAKNAFKEDDIMESTRTVEASQESSNTPPPTRSKTVTVEIPARAEKGKSEPKKKGRKTKAVALNEENDSTQDANECTATTPTTHPPISSPPLPAPSSTILKDKDVNTSHPPPTPEKPSESSSPTKTAKKIHSPINPAGGKVLYRVGLSRRSAIPPLLKMVKPPAAAKPQAEQEKESLDEDGRPRDLIAETMRKWREMGVLD